MRNIEELFKKVNKEKIVIDEHKNSLKNYLVNSEYFLNERKYHFDFKLAFTSVAFSIFIIAITFLYFSDIFTPKDLTFEDSFNDYNITNEQPLAIMKAMNESLEVRNFKEEDLYSKLIKKDDVKVSQRTWQGQEVIVLEVLENDFRTVYYFNKEKTLLLYSEAYENLKDNK